jgi:DNA (cytosine-5)-methyltransferase 1
MKIIDLFAGAGGFSLGAHLAGFQVKLAIDCDEILTSSYKINFPEIPLLLADAAIITKSDLVARTGEIHVDGVIGGPPCQAFSVIGRHRVDDARRDLIYHFFRLVSEINPTFFIMENVPGLAFSAHRHVLSEGLGVIKSKYNLGAPFLLDAADFGLPTRRRRLFIIGVDKKQMELPHIEIIPNGSATVADAIADLDDTIESGQDENGVDWWAYGECVPVSGYARRARERPPPGLGSGHVPGWFSGHRRTRHSARVTKRFADTRPGVRDEVGKHPRLEWNGLCPALRAGTGFDRGRFQSVRPIHPKEARVITVREAARLQGFPDWFVFHPTMWHSFRMIGNSVPPLVAQGVLNQISRQLTSASD